MTSESQIPEIPEHLRERLTTRERALYQRVQIILRGDDTHLEVEASVLDDLFDKIFLSVRRELTAEQEVKVVREELKRQNANVDDLTTVTGCLVELLGRARLTQESQG